VGFGDVARRSLELCLSRPSQQHGPRLIVVGRTAAQRIAPQIRPAFFSGRHSALGLDLDHRQSVRRITPILQAAIIYLPTAEPKTLRPRQQALTAVREISLADCVPAKSRCRWFI